MKNHELPPCLVIAVPVPFASIHVSYVKWTVFGVHALPVRSDEPGPDARKTLFLSLVICDTASATPELGTSTMTSTPSASYQRRAIDEPTSGLFWWSAETISTL